VNARSPYLASGLGHVLALVGLLSLSALQRPPAVIPGVRIVSLGGGARGGGGRPAVQAAERPVAPAPPAEKPAASPKPSPKAAETAPPRERAKTASARGALPAQKQEIVSKTAPKAVGKPATGLAARPPAASAAGAGAAAETGSASGSGPASGHGGVGIEAEGESGFAAGYLALLRDKVAGNWQPPPSIGRLGEARAVIYFVVARSGGQPGSLAVHNPSGVSFFDRAALSAIQSAAPLPPLPAPWPYDSIAIKFTFYQQY
jgi:protein TonB